MEIDLTAAIEAGARALADSRISINANVTHGSYWDDPPVPAGAVELWRDDFRHMARAVLAAAAPLIEAAYEAAYEAGIDQAIAALDSQAVIYVLVAHQRKDITGCICGWSPLGHSHSAHVLGEIVAAVRAKARIAEEGPR